MSKLISTSEGTYWTWYDPETGKENLQVVNIARAGYGKSLLSERQAECLYRNNYKIIYVCDIKNDLEGAFSMFKPTKKDHRKQLAEIGEEPTNYPTEIYHPFTFARDEKDSHLLARKQPKTNFFTIPLKSLGDEEIKFLLEKETQDTDVRIIGNVLRNLNDSDDIHFFFRKLVKSFKKKGVHIGKEYVSTPDPENFMMEGVSNVGNVSNARAISSYFSKFNKDSHYFLSKKDSKYNLDMKKILEDNKTYSVFTCRYIDDEKTQDFVLFWLLNQILKTLPKVRNPVCVVFPEIRKICPRNPKGHKINLGKAFSKFISTVRATNCSTISNTQVYSQVDAEVISLFTDVNIGGTKSADDLGFLAKNYKLSRDVIETLLGLQRGGFISIDNTEAYDIQMFLPRHRHREEGYYHGFDYSYKKEFSEEMRDYKDLLKEMKQSIEESISKINELNKKKREEKELKVKQEIREEKTSKKAKEKIQELEEEKKELKQETKESTKKIIYELSDSGISARKISKELLSKYNIKMSNVNVSHILKKRNTEVKVEPPVMKGESADELP